MKKLIILALLINTHVFAQSPVWKVENGENTLFIGGTIHLLRASDYPLPKGFESAYKQSSTLIFETDLNALKTAEFGRKVFAAVQLPQGEHLYQYLSSSTRQKLQTYCDDNSIDINQFTRFTAAFVSINLALLKLKELGINEKGVDDYYHQKAMKDHKATLGLETPEQQIKFISGIGLGYEDEYILQMMEDLEQAQVEFDAMLKSWRTGDLSLIEKYFIEPNEKQFNELHTRLLVDRNNDWLPKLKHSLNTPETEMVLVGSAHLAGKDGLLALLKKAHYKVTQLD